MIKKCGIVLMAMLIALFFSFRAYGRDYNVISASANGITYEGTVTVSNYLPDVEDVVEIKVTAYPIEQAFIGRSSVHNRTAKYYYDKISEMRLFIGDKVVNSDSTSWKFLKAGSYPIKGLVVFRWKTSKNKVLAGFPEYFYTSKLIEGTTVVVGDSDSVKVNKEEKAEGQGDGGGEGKKPEPLTIYPEISHTEMWNTHRKEFNRRCREENLKGFFRDEDVYWSGEKFMLEVTGSGDNMPDTIDVEIEGTEFGTALIGGGGKWKGELFDESMIGRWGALQPETLIFKFTAVSGGKSVVKRVAARLDDRMPYWMVHRKE